MSAISIRQLKTIEEMQAFSNGYWDSFNGRATQSVHPMDPQVLTTYDNVMGIILKGKIVGGFIVNKYPHRCFDGLTSVEIETFTKKIGGIENCGELVAIWKVKGLKGFSSKVWPRIIIESLRLGKTNIFGCVYSSNKIKETYSVLNPHHVTTVGDSKPLEIFYYERYRLVGTFLANAVIRSYLSIVRGTKSTTSKNLRYKNA